EADLALPRVKSADFIGKEPYVAAREEGPAATLCTLAVEDHRDRDGVERFMTGHEPVLTTAGEPIVDSRGRRSYVTSAGPAPSLGRYLLLAYLPPELAVQGQRVQVEYLGSRFPVSVLATGRSTPFDPETMGVKALRRKVAGASRALSGIVIWWVQMGTGMKGRATMGRDRSRRGSNRRTSRRWGPGWWRLCWRRWPTAGRRPRAGRRPPWLRGCRRRWPGRWSAGPGIGSAMPMTSSAAPTSCAGGPPNWRVRTPRRCMRWSPPRPCPGRPGPYRRRSVTW